MNLELYIVKQGTPESKLLSRAGFDRLSLPVDKWEGRPRSRGGFGSRPFAWRLYGEENVRKLCEAVVSSIGRKSSSILSQEEKYTLDRAKRTLKALNNRMKRAETAEAIALNREKIIRLFLCQRFPSATATEIDDACNHLGAASIYSIEELESELNLLLAGKLSAWKDAVQFFVDVMDIH